MVDRNILTRRGLHVLAITLTALAVSLQAQAAEERTTAEDPEKIFSHANTLFDKATSDEELREAAASYRKLLGAGIRNAHIYYNLGNTQLRLGEHGLSILYFRQSLIFDPNHPFAPSMLEFARRQVDEFKASDERQLADTIFFWHSRYSFSGRLWTLIIALIAFWLMLAMRLFTKIHFHRFAMSVALVLALAMGGSVVAEILLSRGEDGVLIARETEVRSSNGENYDLVFETPVRSGVEVRILDTRNLWHQIEFPGGAVGWVPTTAVRSVRNFE